jgi:hypothetical protein
MIQSFGNAIGSSGWPYGFAANKQLSIDKVLPLLAFHTAGWVSESVPVG